MTARRGISDRERRDMQIGRMFRAMPPPLADLVQLVLSAAEGLDFNRCVECSAAIPEGGTRLLCAETAAGGASLVISTRCQAHSAKHDPTWTERVN